MKLYDCALRLHGFVSSYDRLRFSVSQMSVQIKATDRVFRTSRVCNVWSNFENLLHVSDYHNF